MQKCRAATIYLYRIWLLPTCYKHILPKPAPFFKFGFADLLQVINTLSIIL